MPRSSKRAVRRHHTKRLGRARRKLAAAYADRSSAARSDNELATRHPFDCGSRCFLCHYEKLVEGGRRRARWKREAKKQVDD